MPARAKPASSPVENVARRHLMIKVGAVCVDHELS